MGDATRQDQAGGSDRPTRALLVALLAALVLLALWDLGEAVRDGGTSLRLVRGATTLAIVAALVLVLPYRARRRKETLRERAREHLESLMRSSPQAIVTTDRRGRITYASRAACALTGRAEEELVGRPAEEIYVGGKAEAASLLRCLRERGEVVEREVEVRGTDGSTSRILLSVCVLEGPDGAPVGTLGIGRPATPTNGAATRRDAEALAAIQELSASVAHEVRNPLAGIRGAIQVLQADRDRPPVENAVMGEVLNQIHRMDSMVQDLVSFGSPIVARPRPERLAELVERALGLLRRAPSTAGVAFHADVPPGLNVLADSTLLLRALRIVLENAVHAVAGRGEVRIDAGREDGRVVLRIRDSGPGIGPEHRDDVFRPFFTTKHRGSGLGLAIARRILESHGGTIDFVCPEEGGTVFRLALPGLPAAARIR